MMSKRARTLDSFVTVTSPPNKKARHGFDQAHQRGETDPQPSISVTSHPTYPFALPRLPPEIYEALQYSPASEGRVINDQPDLDLLYFQPFIPKQARLAYFDFMRRELFFYRVQYSIKRGAIDTQIHTPRFTTVFGLDETSLFDANCFIVEASTKKTVAKDAYKCRPRPIPPCLDILRTLTEKATGCKFNFALVNYYASGNDSISYHSDDERFLGVDPAIASFSLGAKRDFLMKHKPTSAGHLSEMTPRKFVLESGDMLLMRGKTQNNWLHSVPKRKGGEADRGRINITFRRALVKGGTENYYRYNVGDGEVYRWDESRREMLPWKGP